MSRRQWLLLGAPLFIPQARAADVPRFTLGVASGHPRHDRMVLWTRLTGVDLPPQVEVRWELAGDEGFREIVARGTETAERAWAHSVHAEPAGLAPDRWYWYRFTALGQRSPVGRTRTAPAPDAPARLRYTIASCQRFDHGLYAAWADMAQRDLDLVLFLGDYIYEYPSPPDAEPRRHEGGLLRTLEQYRERYAQYKGDASLQAAHAAFPWVMVWDDHEVENDYAGSLGTTLQGEAFLRLRAAAYQAYWEHQPLPMASRPVGPDMRLYDRYDWGRLARIHAVDGRQYRDPQACPPLVRRAGVGTVLGGECPELRDPKRSLLGLVQEQWLAEGWDRERPWNLLAQQTLMARATSRPVTPAEGGPDNGRYWTDGWDGYAPARQRLLSGALAHGVQNLVVLGGDVHAHYVAELKTDFDDPRAAVVASEFCTTSISSRGAPQLRVDQILRHNPHLLYGRSDQRGYVAFTLDERRLDAELMVVERPLDAASPVNVAARFVVQAGRPGPQQA